MGGVFEEDPSWDHLQAKAKETLLAHWAKHAVVQSSCSGAKSQVPALAYNSRAQGNPDYEVPIPAHPQKYHFSCCLSSHLLLLQQIAKDRTVLGLDPGYRLSLRAWSAKLH